MHYIPTVRTFNENANAIILPLIGSRFSPVTILPAVIILRESSITKSMAAISTYLNTYEHIRDGMEKQETVGFLYSVC